MGLITTGNYSSFTITHQHGRVIKYKIKLNRWEITQEQREAARGTAEKWEQEQDFYGRP